MVAPGRLLHARRPRVLPAAPVRPRRRLDEDRQRPVSTFGLWFSGDFHLLQNILDVPTLDGGTYVVWMRNSLLYSVSSAILAAVLAAAAGFSLVWRP